MVQLASDEKTSSIMAYTQDSLILADLVTKQGIRINTWLRTDAAPEFIHLVNARILTLVSALKTSEFTEFFLPTDLLIGYHLTPPQHEPLDYDEGEQNRVMLPMTVLMGFMVVRCHVRTSTRTDFSASLEASRSAWMSVYNASLSSPDLPQMPVMQVPMMLLRPNRVSYALEA